MTTTNRQRRSQKKHHPRQQAARERTGQLPGSERAGPRRAEAAGRLEAIAAAYADQGFLAAASLEEARRIDDVDVVLEEVLDKHWALAQERGWDEELARRGLRKHGAALARKLLEHGPLEIGGTLALLGWVMRLPRLPAVTAGSVSDDTRMLTRVRALLAKAESTEFPEEAEAFTAKAQQLITEHCLHEALNEAVTAGGPGLVRILADDPYADAKSLLISVVAEANRCRSVWMERFGFATIVGFQSDLDAVGIIHASLLVQATKSMAAAGSDDPRMRSRSFRRSFLFAFASRIGERLREAERIGRETVADERLLPVLAARDGQVEHVVNELFPHLESQSVSVTNRHGWAAGRSAADHAVLTPFERVQ